MAATGTWIGPTYYEDALATIIDLANNTGTGFSNVPDEVFTSTSAMESWLADRGVYTNIIGNNVTWNQTPTASVTQVLNPANSSSTVTATTQPTVMQQVSTDSAAKTITTQPFRPNGLLTFAQTAGQAVTAASVGIFLGKKIDETLYNLNPDFWDAHGMSSLDPATWSTITNGEDSLGNALFNYVFGIDPQTNETQAYIDQDAFAYMAMWLAGTDEFKTSYSTVTVDEEYIQTVPSQYRQALAQTFLYLPAGTYFLCEFRVPASASSYKYFHSVSLTVPYDCVVLSSRITNTNSRVELICAQLEDTTPVKPYFTTVYGRWDTGTIISTTNSNFNGGYTYPSSGSRSWYYYQSAGIGVASEVLYNQNSIFSITNSNSLTNTVTDNAAVGYYLLQGNPEYKDSPMSNQNGAVLPNPSTWNDINTTKINLENTYPELAQKALTYPVYDPNTQTTTQRTLWPVPVPNVNALNSTQPVGGVDTSQQAQTVTSTSVDMLRKLITDTLAPITTGTTTTTEPPTGDGNSPQIPTISGSASALWSVYNPTQAEVDALGAWLWSTNFLDVVAKMWQDPMQGIISLHKIYAIPPTGVSQNIKVGYLDSGVAATTIPNQYSGLSCGHVDLAETFGNVFDYSPYTSVHLYLPFIGIVQLDVGDVMRASVTVNYRIDWYTGALLAQVIVSRDGNEVLLYQFGGDGAARYPLSQGTNAAIAGLIVGGGVGAIGGAITGFIGGGTAGVLAGVGNGAIRGAATGLGRNIKPNISRSGTFGGNHGAMGIKTPYLIVTRPMPYMPNGYQNLIGNPDYNVTQLGNMSGYVRCAALHLENVPCTDTEMRMIERALLDGVYV